MQEYIEFFQQNMILSLVWIGLFIALIMNVIKSATKAYKEASAAQVTELMNRHNGVVVDIRSRDEYRRGHITDAFHISAADIKDGHLSTLEKHKSDPIIVVCKTGQTAQASANVLAKAGFEQVYVLKSGLAAWNDAKLPLVRGGK